jgi:hypothetical protein
MNSSLNQCHRSKSVYMPIDIYDWFRHCSLLMTWLGDIIDVAVSLQSLELYPHFFQSMVSGNAIVRLTLDRDRKEKKTIVYCVLSN